jgi:hypothetical protein
VLDAHQKQYALRVVDSPLVDQIKMLGECALETCLLVIIEYILTPSQQALHLAIGLRDEFNDQVPSARTGEKSGQLLHGHIVANSQVVHQPSTMTQSTGPRSISESRSAWCQQARTWIAEIEQQRQQCHRLLLHAQTAIVSLDSWINIERDGWHTTPPPIG